MIEKQVAVTVVAVLLLGALGVAYTLWEPSVRAERAQQMTGESARRGAALYVSAECARCHLDNGYGMLQGGVGWPINTTQNQRGSEAALSDRRAILYRTIARGRGAVMPPHLREEGGGLNTEEINELVTYIQHGPWPAPPVEGEAAKLVQGVPAAGGAAGGSRGAQLFAQQGCGGCHQIKGVGGTTGPNLTTIGADAANRKPGTSAQDYLRESITNPNAFVVQGFQPNLMPATFGQTLKPDEIDALIEYLLEQK